MRVLPGLLTALLLASPLFAEPPTVAQVRGWVAKLADEDVAIRDGAQKELDRLGPEWRAVLKDELAKATDPEAHLRLQRLVASLGKPNWHTDLATAKEEAARTGKPLLVIATPGAPDGFA